MTTPIAATLFADPAPAQRLERAATALTAHGFTIEILDDAAAARTRIKDLIPEGASVFTASSETLRLSGIDEDINTSGRYQAVKPRLLAMDRATCADDIRRLLASPDVVVGSVAALTETGPSWSPRPAEANYRWFVEAGALICTSLASTCANALPPPRTDEALTCTFPDSNKAALPACAGGAACAIWIVGAQKVVPDLSTALRRVEDHALLLESARAQVVYGQPSAINRLLILNAEPYPGRGTVLLLREAIGF
jgi:LUD domain